MREVEGWTGFTYGPRRYYIHKIRTVMLDVRDMNDQDEKSTQDPWILSLEKMNCRERLDVTHCRMVESNLDH